VIALRFAIRIEPALGSLEIHTTDIEEKYPPHFHYPQKDSAQLILVRKLVGDTQTKTSLMHGKCITLDSKAGRIFG
jgi:hypothetical protein